MVPCLKSIVSWYPWVKFCRNVDKLPLRQIRALKYVLLLAKVMPKFTKIFGMTFAKNVTYGVPEFAGTEVNQHSGNLKGLMGTCKFFITPPRPNIYHHDTMVGDKTITTRWSETKSSRHDGRRQNHHDTMVGDKTTITSHLKEQQQRRGAASRWSF